MFWNKPVEGSVVTQASIDPLFLAVEKKAGWPRKRGCFLPAPERRREPPRWLPPSPKATELPGQRETLSAGRHTTVSSPPTPAFWPHPQITEEDPSKRGNLAKIMKSHPGPAFPHGVQATQNARIQNSGSWNPGLRPSREVQGPGIYLAPPTSRGPRSSQSELFLRRGAGRRDGSATW